MAENKNPTGTDGVNLKKVITVYNVHIFLFNSTLILNFWKAAQHNQKGLSNSELNLIFQPYGLSV